MGEFGMRWRISVCLHFNTQGTVIDMVWLSHGSHGEEVPLGSRHTDKQTISFLNWKFYSDRPVFTLEKQIRSIFASNEGYVIQAHRESLKHNFSILLNWVRFSKISPKLFEIWQIDQFNIKQDKIQIQTCSICGLSGAHKNFRERLQLMWWFADLVCDRTCFALTQSRTGISSLWTHWFPLFKQPSVP